LSRGGEDQGECVVSTLVRELAAPVISKRRWAAWDLSRYPAAVPALLEALVVEPEQVVREAILDALQHIGGLDVVAGLIPLLHSPDAALRCGVIAVLEPLPEFAARHIISMLHDNDAGRRILAIDLMQTLVLPQTEEWLLIMLEDETRPAVVMAALDCLGSVGSTEILPELLSLTRRFVGQDELVQAVRAVMRHIERSDPGVLNR